MIRSSRLVSAGSNRELSRLYGWPSTKALSRPAGGLSMQSITGAAASPAVLPVFLSLATSAPVA